MPPSARKPAGRLGAHPPSCQRSSQPLLSSSACRPPNEIVICWRSAGDTAPPWRTASRPPMLAPARRGERCVVCAEDEASRPDRPSASPGKDEHAESPSCYGASEEVVGGVRRSGRRPGHATRAAPFSSPLARSTGCRTCERRTRTSSTPFNADRPSTMESDVVPGPSPVFVVGEALGAGADTLGLRGWEGRPRSSDARSSSLSALAEVLELLPDLRPACV